VSAHNNRFPAKVTALAGGAIGSDAMPILPAATAPRRRIGAARQAKIE